MDAPTLIGVVIIVAFVVLCVSAMAFTRNNPDQTLKVLSVFVGVFGVVIGAMGTHFFNEKAISAAREQAAAYRTQLAELSAGTKQVTAATDSIFSTLDTSPTDLKVADLKETPRFMRAVQKYDAAKASLPDFTITVTSTPSYTPEERPRK